MEHFIPKCPENPWKQLFPITEQHLCISTKQITNSVLQKSGINIWRATKNLSWFTAKDSVLPLPWFEYQKLP